MDYVFHYFVLIYLVCMFFLRLWVCIKQRLASILKLEDYYSVHRSKTGAMKCYVIM